MFGGALESTEFQQGVGRRDVMRGDAGLFFDDLQPQADCTLVRAAILAEHRFERQRFDEERTVDRFRRPDLKLTERLQLLFAASSVAAPDERVGQGVPALGDRRRQHHGAPQRVNGFVIAARLHLQHADA